MDKLVKQNLIMSSVKEQKTAVQEIAAFQTNNIPHLDPEKIISKLLEVCDHVVINPVIRPKKRRHQVKCPTEDFEYLIHKQYGSKISFTDILLCRSNRSFTYSILRRLGLTILLLT